MTTMTAHELNVYRMRSFKAKRGPFSERVHCALEEIDRICVEALPGAGGLSELLSPSLVTPHNRQA